MCRRDTLNLFRNSGFQLESFITNRHHLSSSTPDIIIPYVFQATDAVYPERMRSIPTDAVYPERMLDIRGVQAGLYSYAVFS